MKKLIMALMLLASPAVAQVDEFVPNGVITSIKALPANGGINPDFAGVRLLGTIKAGGNPCQASTYEATILQLSFLGRTYYLPSLKQKPNAKDVVCLLYYDANFKGLEFDQTFVTESTLIPSSFVANVYTKGNVVPLESLYATENETPANACATEGPSICTREYNPQVCTYGDLTVRGNNKCEAMINLKASVCTSENAVYDESLVSCQEEGVVFE